jgi:hypothetical protein
MTKLKPQMTQIAQMKNADAKSASSAPSAVKYEVF